MINDEHSTYPTCSQPLVSGDVDGSKRRNKRSKGSGTTRAKPDSISRVQRTSDQGGYVVSSHINVSFAFRGGNYAGEARIVRVDPGGFCIAFPWGGGVKQIQISKEEVAI